MSLQPAGGGEEPSRPLLLTVCFCTRDRFLKKARDQINDDVDESGIDRHELLSWAIETLITASGQAMKQKNPGAVLTCIRQLDHTTGVGYNSHRGHGLRR